MENEKETFDAEKHIENLAGFLKNEFRFDSQ